MDSEVSTNHFGHLFYLIEPTARIYWLYLWSAFMIAMMAYIVANRGRFSFVKFLAYLFPPSVYLHPSAKVDYLFFLLNGVIFWSVIGPVMAFGGVLGEYLGSGMRALLGDTGFRSGGSPWVLIGYTFVLVIIMDLALYIQHWLMHRVPWLWEFHKVHHSAEVLTPITVYRMHPVDDLLAWALTASMGGVTIGLFLWLFPEGLPIFTCMGINVFVFLFYFFGYNLRHSHVWIDYGPRLSKILISPAQHQIHHSSEQRHWDKNFGFMFAIWDWIAGTLYVPQGREEFKLGIGGEELQFRSVARLYLRPFQNVLERWRKRKKQ